MQKLRYFFVIGLVFTMFSCNSSSNKNSAQGGKRSSSGKTLEVIIAADDEVYRGEIKEAVEATFLQIQDMLNQPEALFDIVKLPTTSVYNTDMFRAHRNIVIIDKSLDNKNKVYLAKDKWAYPQVVVEFSVTDNQSFISLLEQHFEQIRDLFYEAEHIRMARAYKGIENVGIKDKLNKNFGFSLTVPQEYRMSILKDDFAWVRKEAKDFSIGVLIYTFPYTDSNIFNPNTIMTIRDNITKRYVAGPADGSYMTTEKRLTPNSKRIRFHDSFGVETRGLWKLEGDFMGGPFVNYMFLDPKGENVIMLDGYVYAPNKPKRDYLMQAEALCYSIKFTEQPN